MIKAGVDQDALINMFSHATARQGDALRKGVREATLKALQGRELTLENMRRVLKSVSQATTAGAALNPGGPVELEAILGRAVAGMDAAMVQAVQANRTALQQFMDLGVGLHSEQMKEALANLEKMEELFFTTIGKVARGAGGTLHGPWEQVFKRLRLDGTESGAQASVVVAQLVEQSHAAWQKGRAASVRAAQSMMDSYASLVSGVLIGMSEALTRAEEGRHAHTGNTRK